MTTKSRLFKTICISLITLFANSILAPGHAIASSALGLPAPTQMIPLSRAYSFPVLKGLKLDPENPLNIEFIIDSGNQKKVTKEDAGRLIKYFLAGLTIPEEDLWVNLSPYEKERVIPEKLAQTDLGKGLLSQDYILKQLSASITHPESATGKDFWSKTYKELYKTLKTTNIPVNTFNKIWVTPETAEIYEGENIALITDAKLKAMLEEDYLALEEAASNTSHVSRNTSQKEKINETASQIMRETILPKINNDINSGKNFSTLRQIYHSTILASWFKEKFQDSFYKNYINKGKIKGINLKDRNIKNKVYNLYVKAFQKGMYDYIKTEKEPLTNKTVKRRYFSGGLTVNASPIKQVHGDPLKINPSFNDWTVSGAAQPYTPSSPIKKEFVGYIGWGITNSEQITKVIHWPSKKMLNGKEKILINQLFYDDKEDTIGKTVFEVIFNKKGKLRINTIKEHLFCKQLVKKDDFRWILPGAAGSPYIFDIVYTPQDNIIKFEKNPASRDTLFFKMYTTASEITKESSAPTSSGPKKKYPGFTKINWEDVDLWARYDQKFFRASRHDSNITFIIRDKKNEAEYSLFADASTEQVSVSRTPVPYITVITKRSKQWRGEDKYISKQKNKDGYEHTVFELSEKPDSWIFEIYENKRKKKIIIDVIPQAWEKIKDHIPKKITAPKNYKGYKEVTIQSSSSLKILVVDDDENNRYDIKKILESSGHTVETANDGQEALAKFENNEYDMVATDKKMPVMDGIQLIRQIRNTNLEIPIILISGTITPDDEKFCESYSRIEPLNKFRPGDYLERVGAIISKIAKENSTPVPSKPIKKYPGFTKMDWEESGTLNSPLWFGDDQSSLRALRRNYNDMIFFDVLSKEDGTRYRLYAIASQERVFISTPGSRQDINFRLSEKPDSWVFEVYENKKEKKIIVDVIPQAWEKIKGHFPKKITAPNGYEVTVKSSSSMARNKSLGGIAIGKKDIKAHAASKPFYFTNTSEIGEFDGLTFEIWEIRKGSIVKELTALAN